jgi:hypothetical protein
MGSMREGKSKADQGPGKATSHVVVGAGDAAARVGKDGTVSPSGDPITRAAVLHLPSEDTNVLRPPSPSPPPSTLPFHPPLEPCILHESLGTGGIGDDAWEELLGVDAAYFPTFNKWLLQSLLLGASVESGGG